MRFWNSLSIELFYGDFKIAVSCGAIDRSQKPACDPAFVSVSMVTARLFAMLALNQSCVKLLVEWTKRLQLLFPLKHFHRRNAPLIKNASAPRGSHLQCFCQRVRFSGEQRRRSGTTARRRCSWRGRTTNYWWTCLFCNSTHQAVAKYVCCSIKTRTQLKEIFNV